ncbi:MAG: hypothetical protein JXQ66_04765 [Campylobacterales bacterium]|nr:hypothetical protein [Campylobacterales bacterium]
MKIAIECRSPLLQKALEMFLSNHLSSAKQCDLIIKDVKCIEDSRCFYISQDSDADLIKPFSRSQLILALEERYKKMGKNYTDKELSKNNDSLDFSILEKRIEFLTQEYKENILKAVRAFYEE